MSTYARPAAATILWVACCAPSLALACDPEAQPIVGDWNGDGTDEPALYREQAATEDDAEG